MLKIIFIGFILLANLKTAYAQNTDSILVAHTPWKKQTIAKTVRLLQYHFNNQNLFNSSQNISIIEVKKPGKKVVFKLAADSKNLYQTSDFAHKENAIAAINGNFFDMKNGGSVDFTKVNGIQINANQLEKSTTRTFHQKAGIALINGALSIIKWDGSVNWEQNIPANDVLLNGPLLRFNAVDEKIDSSAFNKNRHPRTCVGIKNNGTVLLVTIDGRHANAAGMSLFELNKFMKWMGCTEVLNFDGGGSTTLYVKDYGQNGVVNYPTDNKLWDQAGERKVANILYVKKK